MAALPGFQWLKSVDGTTDKLQRKELAPSTQFRRFGLCKLDVNGKVTPIAATTDQARFLFHSPDTLTTATDLQFGTVIELTRNSILTALLVPLLNGVGAVTGSTSTSLILPMAAGATGDLVGSLLLHRPTGSQRVITSNTYSTINSVPCVTLGFVEPLGAPNPKFRITYPNTGDPSGTYNATTPTVGDLCDMYPNGYLNTAVQFDATNLGQQIGNTVAGRTGGTICIEDADLVIRQVKCRVIAL